MSVRYRIEINSPRHRVQNEYFVGFRRNDAGQESVHTERDRATWMSIELARIALRRLREPKYEIRCQLLDEFGNCHSGYEDAPDHDAPLTLHNSHEETTYRDHGVEVPLTFNRSLKKYYLKFSTNPDPNAPGFDQSIAGETPQEVLDRFLSNPHIPAFVIDRYRVDESMPTPAPAAPAIPAGTVFVPAREGVSEVVSFAVRPGNARQGDSI